MAKLNMEDAENIWKLIQQAQMDLSERGEKRTTADWVDAVVNRVNARVMSGDVEIKECDNEIILNVWLIMSLQECAKYKSAALRMAKDIGGIAVEAAEAEAAELGEGQKH